MCFPVTPSLFCLSDRNSFQTKGLSLEQVDILYQNTTPIRSVEYRRRLVAENVHASDPEAIAKVSSRVDHDAHSIEKV